MSPRLVVMALVMSRAWAFDAGDCPAANSLVPLKSIPVDSGISYFMRAASGTREVSFASLDNTNRILEVDSGRVTKVSGNIDPVLSADGKLLAVPLESVYDGKSRKYEIQKPGGEFPASDYYASEGKLIDTKSLQTVKLTLAQAKRQKKRIRLEQSMAFFSRAPDGSPRQQLVDEKVTASYQSIGTLRANGGETHYRMLYQGDYGLRFRDYKMDTRTGAVQTVGLERPACGKGVLGALPIMSHDGRTFTFYDLDTRDTKIMSIDERGQCKELDSIPAMIGKPDFSPDGRRLVFHVDQAIDSKNIEFNKPDNQKLALYTYDRETKALGLLKQDAYSNSYYPTFLSNDEIAYIRARGQGDDMKMSVEIARLASTTGTTCRGCNETPRLRLAANVLGYMYARYCEFPVPNLGTATTALSRLTPAVCRKVIANTTQLQLDKTRTRLAGNLSWDLTHDPELANDALVKKIKPIKEFSPLVISDLDTICSRLNVETISTPSANSSR